MIASTIPTPADLRGAIARKRIHLYLLAPHLALNPTELGRRLNGHRPLSPELALRLAELLDRWPDNDD
jgi:hypothetical protein